MELLAGEGRPGQAAHIGTRWHHEDPADEEEGDQKEARISSIFNFFNFPFWKTPRKNIFSGFNLNFHLSLIRI